MAIVSSTSSLHLSTRGLIINVASISMVVPYVFSLFYASRKAAVVSDSRTLRAELRLLRVYVQAGTDKNDVGMRGKGGLPRGIDLQIPLKFARSLSLSSKVYCIFVAGILSAASLRVKVCHEPSLNRATGGVKCPLVSLIPSFIVQIAR